MYVCVCVCVPSTPRSTAKCYCSSLRLHSLYPYYQLLSFSSLLPQFALICLPLFTTYLLVVLFLSCEAPESEKGLNISVPGMILLFDTLHIISPPILLLGVERWTYSILKFPLLTLCPYLPVIRCCRLEGTLAGHIALHRPLSTYCSFIDSTLHNKNEVQ